MALAQILLRGGTSAEWAAANPVLAARELAVDTTTKRVKVGDGQNAWSALPWVTMDAAEVARLEAAATALDAAADPYDAATATVLALPNGAARQELQRTIDAAVEGIDGGLARPLSRRIVLMGDSITAYNGGLSTATPVQSTGTFDSKGMWRWAQIMLEQDLDIIGNSGIGGQESAQILARFATDVINLQPGIVSILAGTNDDGPEDNTQANLQAMYEAASDANIFVVAFTIPPETNGALATYRQSVNTWIRQYVATHSGIVLVDLASVWRDASQAGFVARSDYMHDTTHPNTRGAQVAARAIADALRTVLSARVRDLPSALAPANMLTNGRFAGSGMSLAAGWSVIGGASYSYVPGPNGVGQRLAVTVPVGGSVTLTQNISRGVLLREGDSYDFTITVEPFDLETPGASTQRIAAWTQNYNGSSFLERKDAVYIDGGASYSSARFPSARGVFRTDPGKLVAGRTLAQVVVSLHGGGTYLLSDAVARNLSMIQAGIAAPENVPHTNLVANGTFETDATGWSGGDSATVARVTSDKHSGLAALQITHTASGNSDGRYQKVAIAPSALLNYVAWVKAPSGHAGRLNFNWFVGGGSYIGVTSVLYTGTGNWEKLIGTIPASSVPSTAGELLLSVARSDATGTPVVLVDDVDVWQV